MLVGRLSHPLPLCPRWVRVLATATTARLSDVRGLGPQQDDSRTVREHGRKGIVHSDGPGRSPEVVSSWDEAMTSRARIIKGRWTRRITWEKDGVWRTDIFKSVLNDPRLQEAEFVCVGGPRIVIPVQDLRDVLPMLYDHYSGRLWGPFNIDPAASTIDGHPVKMAVL